MGGVESSQVFRSLSSEGSWEHWESHIKKKYRMESTGGKNTFDYLTRGSAVIYQEVLKKTNSMPRKQYLLRMIARPNTTEIHHMINLHLQKSPLKNVLNILQAQQLYQGNLCMSGAIFLALFEYVGTHSLEREIQYRKSLSLLEHKYFSISELLSVFKFLIQCFYEAENNNCFFPPLSLSDILIPHEKSYKYRNFCEIMCFQSPEIDKYYHSPQNWRACENQSEFVFSFGMCMINLALLGGIEECYDYRNLSICVSILQEKYEMLRMINSTQSWIFLCDVLESMTQEDPFKRPTIGQCSSFCNEILQCIRQEENQKTLILSDISTSCNNPVITRTANVKAHVKYTHNFAGKKGSCQFSSGNKKENWSLGSSEKKEIEINGSVNKKLAAWKVDMRQKQNGMILERIDKKWKQQDEIFQNMPDFQEIDHIFEFELDNNIFSRMEIRKTHTHTSTLKTDRS